MIDETPISKKKFNWKKLLGGIFAWLWLILLIVLILLCLCVVIPFVIILSPLIVIILVAEYGWKHGRKFCKECIDEYNRGDRA